SPYHHVLPGVRYPALLLMAADSDDRVDPMHARKFAAEVQWATAGSDRPTLFRVEEHAGHGGADLVKKRVAYNTDLTAFLLDQLAPPASQNAPKPPKTAPPSGAKKPAP
ncbi:MAG TPA: prolyl oligopeptidase family serine peptidase, partial [Polyangiaceae bacterium]|nr:prolyl oligopeptidase family serine peptidase [Polyangiaceae bacterium]